jgi:hypothetical protein
MKMTKQQRNARRTARARLAAAIALTLAIGPRKDAPKAA